MSTNTYLTIAMVIYLLAMLVIGFSAYRQNDTYDDYMLAGRGLGPMVAALSAGASDMSGWLLMGLPGAIYASGLVNLWIAVGLTVGAWVNWKVVAPRLRSVSEATSNSITIPSFLSNRVNDSRNIIRISAGIVILIFFTFYVSAGLVSGGVFFESFSGVDYRLGLVIVAAITVLYTLVGGFLAVSWTDFVQGIMMVTALVMVPIVGIWELGGVGELFSAINSVDPKLLSLTGGATVVGVISSLAWGLGYFGQPHILVRFMALRSAEEARAGRRIGIGWMLLAVIGAGVTALVGIATYTAKGQPLENPETVFIALSQLMFHPLIAGFMLAAILAAIMSTISSQLLVTSSALVEDIYNAVSKQKLSDYAGVLWGRAAVLLTALVAAILAWSPSDTILELVAFAWAGFGAAFGPSIILALYWKKLEVRGVVAGILAGTVVVILWKNLGGGIFDLYEILPGVIANFLFTYLVSRFAPSKSVDSRI